MARLSPDEDLFDVLFEITGSFLQVMREFLLFS